MPMQTRPGSVQDAGSCSNPRTVYACEGVKVSPVKKGISGIGVDGEHLYVARLV